MTTTGDPRFFAIESHIAIAYSSGSMKALGCFLLHIAGKRFGVAERDATLLACSVEQVQRRLAMRGFHVAEYAENTDAYLIAKSAYDSVYNDCNDADLIMGVTYSSFTRQLINSEIVWAPDGDQAFDDGSHVLQFDIGSKTRLIGYRATKERHVDPDGIAEIIIDSDIFYSILQLWLREFETEWGEKNKIDPPEMNPHANQ